LLSFGKEKCDNPVKCEYIYRYLARHHRHGVFAALSFDHQRSNEDKSVAYDQDNQKKNGNDIEQNGVEKQDDGTYLIGKRIGYLPNSVT